MPTGVDPPVVTKSARPRPTMAAFSRSTIRSAASADTAWSVGAMRTSGSSGSVIGGPFVDVRPHQVGRDPDGLAADRVDPAALDGLSQEVGVGSAGRVEAALQDLRAVPADAAADGFGLGGHLGQ